jgi:hypothetical protein
MTPEEYINSWITEEYINTSYVISDYFDQDRFNEVEAALNLLRKDPEDEWGVAIDECFSGLMAEFPGSPITKHQVKETLVTIISGFMEEDLVTIAAMIEEEFDGTDCEED